MTVAGISEQDVERLEIVEALKHFAEHLEVETRGLTEAAMRYRPAAGEWCIKEVIGHCWFAEQIWYKRLYMTWSLTDPILPRFDGEDGAIARAYEAPDVRPLLRDIEAWRPRIVDLLADAIDWTRIGQWPGEGRRSLKQLAQYLVSHDADHIQQLRALKAAQGLPIDA